MPNFRTLIKLSRPLQLLLAALTYLLGVGMAHYLGQSLRQPALWLGLLAALTLQNTAFLLAEYFRLPFTPLAENETRIQRERFRILLFQVAAAVLTLSAVATVMLLYARLLSLPAGVLLALMFLFLVAYAVPPLRMSETGFGELVMAFFLASLLPALAFLLQTGLYHRLLAMVTFPLTLLALAYLIILDFPTFATNQKLARHTLLTRLTWQRAVPIHHLLILASFLLFAAAPLFGFPWNLVWPVFLALPFAGLQIYWLQRIANGGRTLWKFLTALAAATFGLTAYLLALTFWIR
jgi:1,4-dihydroxy-2-naphthoate octaprenyltransferase